MWTKKIVVIFEIFFGSVLPVVVSVGLSVGTAVTLAMFSINKTTV